MNRAATILRILHISCDFPDVLSANKTQAIKRLLEGAPEHHHTVYSLNRVDGLSGIEIIPFGSRRFAVAYRAPPKGLLLRTRLMALANFILEEIKARGFTFDIVHAHKLTIEGIVGHHIARSLNLPIAFSVQGDTDFKVMSARPDLTDVFRRHVDDASEIFCFAPWSLKQLHAKFPSASQKTRLLPVAPGQDDLKEAPVVGQNRLVSVFHLDSWKRKNLGGMARAVKSLSAQMPDIHLDIIGGGSPKSFMEATEAVRTADAEHLVTFKGPVANQDITPTLHHYAAFILPTLRESYGLVHAEAMFAGLPVLVSENMGIDGVLPETDFIASCDPRSTQSIANAMVQLLENETGAKSSLADAQRSGLLNKMRRAAIFDTYKNGLLSVFQNSAIESLQLQVTQ